MHCMHSNIGSRARKHVTRTPQSPTQPVPKRRSHDEPELSFPWYPKRFTVIGLVDEDNSIREHHTGDFSCVISPWVINSGRRVYAARQPKGVFPSFGTSNWLEVHVRLIRGRPSVSMARRRRQNTVSRVDDEKSIWRSYSWPNKYNHQLTAQQVCELQTQRPTAMIPHLPLPPIDHETAKFFFPSVRSTVCDVHRSSHIRFIHEITSHASTWRASPCDGSRVNEHWV